MRKLIVIVGALFMLTSCGYKMAGLDGSDIITYYITGIHNRSDDYTFNTQLSDTITRFFYNYGALRDRDKAQYLIQVVLLTKRVYVSTESDTREALSSELELRYHIYVTNQNGRVVYDRILRRTKAFYTGATITQFNKNSATAFDSATDDIFSGFKYAFEQRR